MFLQSIPVSTTIYLNVQIFSNSSTSFNIKFILPQNKEIPDKAHSSTFKTLSIHRFFLYTGTSQSVNHNFFGISESSFHKLNGPKSLSYCILFWKGLFISIFERAHERTEKLNKAKPGPKVCLVFLGIFNGKMVWMGIFIKIFERRPQPGSLAWPLFVWAACLTLSIQPSAARVEKKCKNM